MKRIAVYPGSFDPVTNGHLDIIERASHLFDHVVVAIGTHFTKRQTFSSEVRLALLKTACQHLANVEVQTFNDLTVNFARRVGANVLVRGIRALNDFEYEFQMALMNNQLDEQIENVFLMTRADHLFISSTLVKELASYRQDVSKHVPKHVNDFLIDFYSNKDPQA